MFDEEDLVFSYSRADAISDGVLVDITEIAKECGFKVPVAMNFITYSGFLDEGELNEMKLSSFMLSLYLRISEGNIHTDSFNLGDKDQTIVHLHGGDNGEAVLTIYLLAER